MIAELTRSSFFKVVGMLTKRLCLVILVLVIGCHQVGIGADGPTSPANDIGADGPTSPANDTIAEAKFGKQLKINRDALFEGSSEEIRIDAATVMLFSEEPQARRILLGALSQTENAAARIAVCRALSQARASGERVKNKEDFVQPLFGILTTETVADAQLAAEATRIFEYRQISGQLGKIVTDSSLPANARLNAIAALKLQPDKRVIFKLIQLLDDPEKQVAAGSEMALISLGIPVVGKDAETLKEIIKNIESKGTDAFLRYWINRQDNEMRELESKLDWWRKQYLSSLGKIYDGIGEDTSKGKFLAEHLVSSEAVVRLWALENVSQWRQSTKPKLPSELGPILVELVSDRNRAVRLKTARLLSLMGELNSAEKLLDQLEIEQDNEVRMELFVALGEACRYAFLPNSKLKIPQQIRKQTLEWAVKYLFEEGSEKAEKGAKVIRKLLEQDGLTSGDVERYLGLLAERYEQEKESADGALRGELLGAMAGLCAQNVYKAESAKLFKPLFEKALRDETDLVREAAVKGLIYIDTTRALKILRKDFVNDSSIEVRQRLIELAGEVGGEGDLVWLVGKIGTTAESEPAWQAMLKIFKRSEAGVLAEWIDKFDSPETKGKLSDEQKLSVLEIGERKAVGENKPEMIKNIREKLASLYSKNGKFAQAADYLGMLHEAGQSVEEKEPILARLVDVYLRGSNVKAAKDLLDNYLLQKDLEPNSVIVRSIENYLTEPAGGVEPKVMLEALSKIVPPEPRPKWQEQLKLWTDRLGQVKWSVEAEEADN